MAECKHVFIGKPDGAHCVKCGIHMTITEYLDYMRPKIMAGKPNRQIRKKVKTGE